MYVYNIHIHISVYLYTYICKTTYACICICMNIHIYIYRENSFTICEHRHSWGHALAYVKGICIYTGVYVYIFTNICMYMHIDIGIYIRIHMYFYINVYMYACIYMYVYIGKTRVGGASWREPRDAQKKGAKSARCYHTARRGIPHWGAHKLCRSFSRIFRSLFNLSFALKMPKVLGVATTRATRSTPYRCVQVV